MAIFGNKSSTLTKLLAILKIFFRFTYIESFVVPGNLSPFFNLKFEYFILNFLPFSLSPVISTCRREIGSIREKQYLFHQVWNGFTDNCD